MQAQAMQRRALSQRASRLPGAFFGKNRAGFAVLCCCAMLDWSYLLLVEILHRDVQHAAFAPPV